MTYSSLAGTRLPINDIKAFADIISTGFEYHTEHNSIHKSDYRKSLIVMGSLGFSVIMIKDPFVHNLGAPLDQFLNNRNFEADALPFAYAETLAYAISQAVLLMPKYSPEDYEYALLKRVKQLFGNVWVSITGKQKEADRLSKLLGIS